MEKAAFVRLQKREEMAALPGQLQDLADDLLEATRRRCLSRQCGDENPLQVVENVEDRVEVQILLRFKIPIDRALADPGFGGDVVDQDIMEILGRKDFGGGSEDLSLFSDSFGARHFLVSSDSDTDRSVSISHTGFV